MVDEPRVDELTIVKVLHALGEPTRFAVVVQIAAGERLSGALRADVARSTLSQHLRVLQKAGVTHTRRAGAGRWLSLRRADLDVRFPGLLDAVLPPVDGVQPVRAVAAAHWWYPTSTNRGSGGNAARTLLTTSWWSDW